MNAKYERIVYEGMGFRTRATFDPRMHCGLSLLADAYRYSIDLNASPDELAVELRLLCAAGLTEIDLRWLQRKGYVRHLVEILPPSVAGRAFDPAEAVMFTERSCFILTAVGMEIFERMISAPCSAPSRQRTPGTPLWDMSCRELRWGTVVLKKFRVPAPNQELILTAFEEEGWPSRMDDPLGHVVGLEPKRRLHDTIVALNRHHSQPIVRFAGDGTGQGILWRLIA